MLERQKDVKKETDIHLKTTTRVQEKQMADHALKSKCLYEAKMVKYLVSISNDILSVS